MGGLGAQGKIWRPEGPEGLVQLVPESAQFRQSCIPVPCKVLLCISCDTSFHFLPQDILKLYTRLARKEGKQFQISDPMLLLA